MAAGNDLAALVAEAATECPDKVALVEAAGRRMTWSALDEEVSRVAAGLGSMGVVAGHRVLIVVGNRLEFVTTYLGVLRAQAVAVPVNPGSTGGELARMIADSGARVAVAETETITVLREAVDLVRRAVDGDVEGLADVDPGLLERVRPVRVVAIGTTLRPDERSYDQLLTAELHPIPPLPDPEKLAALLYTSGTSGRPRAAMLTHRALLSNVEQVAAVEPPMMMSDDVVLGVLPLFHVYGLGAVLGGVIRHRAKLVLAERFDPQGTLDLIEDEACSVVPVAPPVFQRWRDVPQLRERLGPVRLVLSGAAPLSAETIESFREQTGVAVHQGYGLTEAAPVVTSTLCSADPAPGSVGAALPGIDIRLVDDGGKAPEGDDPGEIAIRGDNLFSGYWPDGADGPDDDGWWATGDVGYLDASGDLVLVDRIKELVIVSGFNVYPAEVEDVVAEVEGVGEVAVIGAPDEETGEAVVAYVVPDDDADQAALADAVRTHCEERLARFKRPSRVEVVGELPLTVTGKVQKGRLRGIERRRALGILDG